VADQDLLVLQPTRATARKKIPVALHLCGQLAGRFPGRRVVYWMPGPPEDGLRRELVEEVNLEVTDVKLLLARTLPGPRQVEIYFLCTPLGTPTPTSFEITKAEWFTVDNLPDDLSKDQRRLIERALSVRKKLTR